MNDAPSTGHTFPPPIPDQRVEDQPGGISVPRPIVPILPEGEALVQPPLDNTPGDHPDFEPPTRIPNLGHAMLFLAITGTLLLISQLVLLSLFHAKADAIPPKLLLGSQTFTYLGALIISWFIFPLLWRKPFEVGLRINAPAATRNALRLIPIGITISFVVQAASSLITMPKSVPMDDFFHSTSDVWLITAFGTLLAPFFEEVAFRGFLLPGFAIAYDWLSLPRLPAAREQWNSTNIITTPALAFSAIVTSILFALLHGAQTSFTWPVLVLLFLVSLVLNAVRIRLRSVLASTFVHASYNFAVFLTAFIATGGYRHLDHLSH